MKFSAALDVHVVAHETTDELTVLLHIDAPESVSSDERAPSALQVVLDRSGSMHGAPLEGAKRALITLVQRLSPTDIFGLVTFDDQAQIVVPAGPMIDKSAVIARIIDIQPGGTTDLSSGYLRGLRDLRRAIDTAGIRGGTLLVVSDGHVNAGIRDADEMAGITAGAAGHDIVTSTLGYGQGYDETMLAAMARSGNGNHVFAENPDAASAAIAGEVDGLLSKVAQAVSVTVGCAPQVRMLQLYNDLPAHQLSDGRVMIELGDLYAQESRKMLLRFGIDGLETLGLTQVALLELQYVEMPGVMEHTVSLPISVNVIPGDEMGDRLPDATVQSERLFQEAQATKLEASRAYEVGDLETGSTLLGDAARGLQAAASYATDDAVLEDILAEHRDINRMRLSADEAGAGYMSKLTRDSYHQQNRKRGRRRG